MTETTNSGNNGTGKLKPANPNSDREYSTARILITDEEAYNGVVLYLKNKEAKEGEKYVLYTERVVKKNPFKGIVELIKVDSDIKKEIEKIVMRYSD